MDWLEEQWTILKQKMQDAGLLREMMLYLLMGIFAASVLAYLTRNICETWRAVLEIRYPGEDQYHSFSMALAVFLEQYALYIYVCFASLIAVRLFFTQKLYPAIGELKGMIANLAMGDYGHEISYQSEDEIGKLCKEADYLRNVLLEEKKRQWESEEEQRKINAAFAHDLRTPLTVIKGYTEFLLKYIPKGRVGQEVLLEKLETIQAQQERLFVFAGTMAGLQKIGQRAVNGSWMQRSKFCDTMKDSAQALAREKGLVCEFYLKNMEEGEIFADPEMILEVFENLLYNAVRYAKEKIEIHVQAKERRLILSVKDDGCGFSAKALRAGKEIYFSEEKESGEHFGIGLYISKTLCEKHGGELNLINSVEQGAIAIAEFLCRYR